ncbi:hypothetical protein GCM10009558_103890 [Virgisporangium aurantiacum]
MCTAAAETVRVALVIPIRTAVLRWASAVAKVRKDIRGRAEQRSPVSRSHGYVSRTRSHCHGCIGSRGGIVPVHRSAGTAITGSSTVGRCSGA